MGCVVSLGSPSALSTWRGCAADREMGVLQLRIDGEAEVIGERQRKVCFLAAAGWIKRRLDIATQRRKRIGGMHRWGCGVDVALARIAAGGCAGVYTNGVACRCDDDVFVVCSCDDHGVYKDESLCSLLGIGTRPGGAGRVVGELAVRCRRCDSPVGSGRFSGVGHWRIGGGLVWGRWRGCAWCLVAGG